MNSFIFILNLLICSYSLPQHYHTTDQLNSEIDHLKNNCNQELNIYDSNTSPSLKIAHINSNRLYKAFFVFGEHARELISPEVGLNFLKKLCTETSQTIAQNFEIKMIINANPISRTEVENGQFCLRENENNVDLNRNYDIAWEKVAYNVLQIQKKKIDDELQISSGSKPFSESETQLIKSLLEEYKPDIFFSIHSGTLGLYTPYAYKQDQVKLYGSQMTNILEKVKKEFCPGCEVGPAGSTVGYLSPGSSLDYAYEKLGIGYSFAFEIYHHSQNSFLELQGNKRNLRKTRHPCLIQRSDLRDPYCFSFFNPESKEDYNQQVNNWSSALECVLEQIYEQQQSQGP